MDSFGIACGVTFGGEGRIRELPSRKLLLDAELMNRRAALLSSLMILGALPVGAQEVEYAVGTTRYRVSTTTKGTQSTPMGNSGFELGMRQELTLNLARQSKDTMLATVTLDSIALTGDGEVADVSALRGGEVV